MDVVKGATSNFSQNPSVQRKMALHIVPEQKDKLSIKKRLYKATLEWHTLDDC